MTNAPTPIIDCDVHPSASKHPVEKYVAREFHEAMKQGLGGKPAFGYANPFGVNRRDVACNDPHDTARDLLDRYNIVYAVLQPPGLSTSLTCNIDVGSALARAWNEWQTEEWLNQDGRYLGSICVNMNDSVEAAREIRRAKAAHKNMVQVVVCGESSDLYGHRRYYPIYEACEEVGIPFCIHPGTEGSLTPSTPVGCPSNYFEWHSGIPLTFQAHLISMVTEGVFVRFPGLKLVLVEAGIAWLAHTTWRLDKNFKSLRSIAPWLKEPPSHYIRTHVRMGTQPLEEPANPAHLAQMMDMVNAQKTVIYASDFPHWDFDDPHRILQPLDETLKRRIFYENAAELYGLPPLNETLATAPGKG